jgi:hypothetical protein
MPISLESLTVALLVAASGVFLLWRLRRWLRRFRALASSRAAACEGCGCGKKQPSPAAPRGAQAAELIGCFERRPPKSAAAAPPR